MVPHIVAICTEDLLKPRQHGLCWASFILLDSASQGPNSLELCHATKREKEIDLMKDSTLFLGTNGDNSIASKRPLEAQGH